MNKVMFSDGSFVIHKIPGIINNAHVSAWYHPDGSLKDCAYYLGDYVERNIPHTWCHVLLELALKGKYYV